MKENKEREVGIELLRIVTMIMIILQHFCDKPGFTSQEIFASKISEIAWFLEGFANVAVNCYIFISGYFLIKSECRPKKLLNIWKEVLFYSVSIFLLFIIFFKKEMAFEETLRYFFPITLKLYWFISIYAIMYLLAPFLNKCLLSVNQKEFKRLLSILLIVSWVSSTMKSFGYDVIDTTNGYGIWWFITLYTLGAYIRLYSKNKRNKNKYYLIKYLIISVFVYITRIILYKMCQNGFLSSDINCNLFYKYNSITLTFSSLYLFLFFKNLNIRTEWIKKIILKISPLTLAVYIIHETPLVREVLYKNILRTDLITRASEFVIALPISCIMIFVTSCLIECFRIKLFELSNIVYYKVKNRR